MTTIFKKEFGTAMDTIDNTRFLFVNAKPGFYPLFTYVGKTDLDTGSIYCLPFYLSAEHEQVMRKLKENEIVLEYNYI